MLTVEEIRRLLDVSPATVRRDLTRLEAEGRLRRIANGALRQEEYRRVLMFTGEPDSFADPLLPQKRAIAAVELVRSGDTLFMDSGSTNNEIASLLVDFTDLTIVTNSVEIAVKFCRRHDVSVIVCGGSMGEVRPVSSLVGPLAEMMIVQFRAALAFIGASGIDPSQGVTDPHVSAARLKQKMIDNAAKVALVADHTKFGQINKAFVCPIERLHAVYTDADAPADALAELRRRGVATIVCDG